MSLKGTRTTADYLPWNEMVLLTHKLIRDGQKTYALLIAVGCYTGLRISDLRKLTWGDMQDSPLVVTEKKTGKTRTIHLHNDLLALSSEVKSDKNKDNDFLFTSSRGEVYSLQYINRKLKAINDTYRLGIQFTTHTFRKTFGRRIWEKHDHSEKSLLLLSQIFNHTSIAITKRYLGIRDEEIQDVYLSL